MMPKTYFALAIVACAFASAHAIFGTLAFGPGAALTSTAAGAATGTTLFLTPTGATVIAGAVVLKGLAIAALAASAASRSKRDVEQTQADDIAFVAVARSNTDRCIERLVCDIATGQMPKSEIDVIDTLFNKPTATESPKFPFAVANKVGKVSKDVTACEYRYSCPLSGQEIAKLFN